MALTRRMLKELGLEDESIEKIMSEHGKVMEGMTTKAQAEENIKKALEEFQTKWETEHPPVQVKDTAEYKELEQKYNNFVFDTQLKNAKVKDKYVEFVKSKLSKEKPFEEAIKDVQSEYAEFFESEKENDTRTNKPSITGGSPVKDKETETPSEVEKLKADFAKAFGHYTKR